MISAATLSVVKALVSSVFLIHESQRDEARLCGSLAWTSVLGSLVGIDNGLG